MRAALLAAVAALFPYTVCAQSLPEKIDAGHSYAVLWMGRDTETTAAVNTGVAQVAGTANLAAKDPAAASFAVNLVPGGGGARLLTPQGTLRTGEIAPIARYAVMSFQATSARVRRDGRLELTGDLTVTHVTREVILGAWNLGYSGSSTYSDPVTKTVTRQVKFVVTTPHAEFLPNYLNEEKEITAAATIDARDYPELPDIVLESDWPTVAQDEYCPPPMEGPRRDYSGVTCTGKGIAVSNPADDRHSFGVDYSGMRHAVAPVDGPVTIVLHLKILPSLGRSEEPSAAAPPSKPPAQ
jgi:polyisoprenoid-binding protein YceI